MPFQRRLTTRAVVDEVRSLVDEENVSAVSDAEIVASLNRAQDRVATIMAKHYNPPLLTEAYVTLDAGTIDYVIPEDALEQRLVKVDWTTGAGFQRLDEISIRDLARYQPPLASAGGAPYYYCIIGDTYRILPGNGAGGQLRIFYLADPAPLVLEQGRITLTNTAGNYLIVDELGDGVSTDADELESYVNVVDKNTGRIKGTLQVQSISDRKVTFRATPTRATVQDRTVLGVLPATVEQDDYLCGVAGTCVPFMKKPASNYILQYAAADVAVTKLGADPGILMAQTVKMEEDVTRSWSGRPNTARVRSRSNSWNMRSGGRR